MNSAISIALSGLNAAGTRLQVAANNIANANSTQTQDADGAATNQPYQPEAVVQTSQASGGVQAQVVNTNDQPLETLQPNNPGANAQGEVATPNVDPGEQLVQAQLATYDFQANLKTLTAQQHMQKTLLNIIT